MRYLDQLIPIGMLLKIPINNLLTKIAKPACILFCCLMAPAHSAISSDNTVSWQPERSIVITVPSNPGGGWDQLARFIQHVAIKDQLSNSGVEVINRGGAGGIIALSELVARFDGNPNKLMITGFGMVGATAMHQSEFNLLSATPLARLTSEYQALAVPYDSPITSLSQLIEQFTRQPDSIVWGGGSAGGADHLFINLLAEKLNINASDINYVAFTGGGEASAALMGGQVDVGVSGYSEWQSLVRAKRIRLIAISSAQRIEHDDTPTFKESGLDLEFANWRGLLAAPNISEAQKAYLLNLLERVYLSPTWKQILEKNQWQDSYLTGQEFAAFIDKDMRNTQRLVTRSGLGKEGRGYAAIGPHFFPILAGLGMLITIAFIHTFECSKETCPPANLTVQPPDKTLLKIIAVLVFYLIGLNALGFVWTTPFLLPVLTRIYGSDTYFRDFFIGTGLTLSIYFIFEHLLKVSIP